ncbi:MAG: hypothetical protein CMH83_18985 [Nocardioides sp.]|nr:hypothetical protein [Nocardioides sp.]
MTTAPKPTPSLEDCQAETASEAIERAAALLAAATMAHPDGAELVALIATEATRLLPRGMSLVDGRPGSWEASLVEQLVEPTAVSDGPGPTPLDLECPRCSAPAGQGCWNPRTYVDNRHPHRERVAETKMNDLTFSPEYGWW